MSRLLGDMVTPGRIVLRRAELVQCVVIALLMLAAAPSGAQRGRDQQKPVVSDQSLTPDELAIYHEVLNPWIDDGKHAVHLSLETVPLEEDAKTCVKGVRLEASDGATVHHFLPKDLPQLGSAQISLVDPEAGSKDVEKNDPGAAIQKGKSVDEAVDQGFAHGLVTLSEIQFDEKHQMAIVWFGFRCGSLCGNGGTVVLEKKNGVWHKRKRPCSFWMS